MGMLNTEPAKDFNTGLMTPQLGIVIEVPDADWITLIPNYPTASSSSQCVFDGPEIGSTGS